MAYIITIIQVKHNMGDMPVNERLKKNFNQYYGMCFHSFKNNLSSSQPVRISIRKIIPEAFLLRRFAKPGECCNVIYTCVCHIAYSHERIQTLRSGGVPSFQ